MVRMIQPRRLPAAAFMRLLWAATAAQLFAEGGATSCVAGPSLQCDGSSMETASLLQAKKFSGTIQGAAASESSGEASQQVLVGMLARLEASQQVLVGKMDGMREEVKEAHEEMQKAEKIAEFQATQIDNLQAKSPVPDASLAGVAVNSPAVTALLLAKLGNQSGELAQSCARKAKFGGASPRAVEVAAVQAVKEAAAAGAFRGAACSDGMVALLDFGVESVKTTCCSALQTDCAGCASSAGNSCQLCAGGFLKRKGGCMACADSAGWASERGLSCAKLPGSACSDVKVRGESSNEACCQCGGGHITPTPFVYPDTRWSLGSQILLQPMPRTAERYTLNKDCELAAWNMTMDGSTGAISTLPGRSVPSEAFSFQCEVTAHQVPGVSLTVVVMVAADFLTYESNLLVFNSGTRHQPRKSNGLWTDFGMSCAPRPSWLQISSDGELSLTTGSNTESGAAGGVTAAEEDTYFGQDGAVCVVTALSDGRQKKTSFVVVKPRPWPSLKYDSASVAITIGEELVPMQPQLPGGMQCEVACNVIAAAGLPDTILFEFDRVLRTGFVAGQSILQVGADGQVSIAPSFSLSEVFDSMDPVGSARKTLSLHCGVWGVFADLGVPPVKAALDIELRDSICWVPQSFAGQALEDAAAMSQPQCRSRCRASKSCSHFLWSPTEKTCWRYRLDALGPEVTAFAKVTSCTEGITCLDVKHDAWYLAGQYCPLGQDSWRGGVVYRQAGATVQDSSFLSAYHSAAVDGEVKTLDGSSCSEGDWILRAQAPGHDFVDVKSGRFALRGEAQSCVSEPQGNVTWAVNDCAAPNLGPGQEGGLQALVVDDPNTVPAEDFWLHPCDCGQFSCPSRQLLPGKAGLHYETETEAFEASACESRCRVQESCRFFFQGTQHGTKTCRLFSDCDSLVREFSLSGKLMAMPRQASCQVSDPEACWATTMRRSFLSSSAFSFSSQSEKQSPSGRALPPKPADPPAEGMVAWFKSQNAGSTWPSSVGEFVGTAGQRGVIRELGAGYGADQPVTYINGGTNSDFDFGKVLKSTFSICSVSRYTGGAVKEILGGGSRQMSHGHWGGQAGVAYYQAAKKGGNQNLKANGCASSGNSDFAVMEVITWDRALSQKEFETATQYLQWRLRVGAQVETSEHLATLWENNFKPEKEVSDVKNTEFVHDLSNGYQATLTGWTHTRFYANGFVRNIAGNGTAVIDGLTPGAPYLYHVYQRSTFTSQQVQHQLSVNHGPAFSTFQNDVDSPSASGLVVATPRGEIRFEFIRIGGQVHLSGMALAAVGSSSAISKPADPPAEGMVAWFKSQNAGSTWPSSVGEFVGTAGQRGVIRELGAGYGADQPVTYINGGTNSDFDFGKVLKSTFSICSVSRYTGGAVKEILGGGSRQMSHGHWGGQAGVAYYQEWVTPSSNKGPSMDWLVFCGTNGDQQVYDGMKNIATKAAKKGGNQNLKANGCASSGNSDFAVMEVITWDRALSQKEFETATQYLQWRLRVGAQVETSEHLATLWENNFKPEKEVSDVSNTEFVHDLSNGYKATLTGWTHTRFYADGFVRNIAGSGTAVIDGLTPGAPYLYHVYQRSTFTSQQVQHQLSVNHGPAFNTFQNEVDSPSASGLVVATPRGEIRFEFIRIGGQVHLSGIALALAGDEAALVQSDASSKARSLGSAAARESGFRHLHLYQQCDTAKLLGGLGVEACARPAHREPASHSWQHKRPLPKTFGHGSQLLLSCWEERFAGLQGSEQEGRSEQLACVNGEWFNSQDQPQLGDFTCQACVQVAGPGYAAYDQRNEQELYHFNRMKLSIFSELGMVAELSKHPKNTYCLQQAAAGVSSSAMSVVASTSCPAVLVAQVTSESEPESRVVRLLGEGEATAWQCLAGVSTPEGSATLEHTACNTSDRSQLVNPGELAMSMWTLLVESSREQHGLQGAYAAYCGKQAALNNLNFGQVFAGNMINSSTTCSATHS
ncbi:unnamed protein product, partial [Polarella glacialis]